MIGCGSIGERHVRSFLATGRTRIVACDTHASTRGRIASAYGVPVVEDWELGLSDPAITAVLIATPAPLHVAIALRALASGRHVLIEKPLALKLAGTDDLLRARDQAGRFAAVAYVLHCAPALVEARRFLQAGTFGPVRHAVIVSGQHFPSFRPAYRRIYYSDHAQGGGAIYDALTHSANAVEWILGPATRVFCDAAHQVLPDVVVEDTVNVTARHGDVLVSYALNQFQAPNEQRWDFHAKGGSVRIELSSGRWGTLARGAVDWTWHDASVPGRDHLYIAQAHAFLDGCAGQPHPLCTLEEAIQTLRFNRAAHASWRTGCPTIP